MNTRKHFGFYVILGLLTVGISFLLVSSAVIFTSNGGNGYDKDVQNSASFNAMALEDVASEYERQSEKGYSDRGNETVYSTLAVLGEAVVDENDPVELAARFKGLRKSIAQKKEVALEKPLGRMKNFWVLNVDNNQYQQVDAVLAYRTPHLYFWIQDGIEYDPAMLANLAENFENRIYPTTREIFGSEWSPGVDNDTHLVVLFTQGMGGAAGYFSATDSLEKLIEPYSNEAEMFYLSAEYTRLDDLYTYGVLAHEFQHMIHWNVDRNEDAWVNEGLSELAMDLNGFDTGGFDYLFAINPDIQLNFWPGGEQGSSSPHYGASYLFMRYLFDRFGSEFISSLVVNKENGFKGLDATLKGQSQSGKSSLESISSEKLFQQWTLANLIQDSSIQGGIYAYQQDKGIPEFRPTEVLGCREDRYADTVNQFGTDYIQIQCDHDYQIEIQVDGEIPVLPIEPYSGNFYYWSNYGHQSHMRLFQKFDFRGLEGPIFLEYKTWFDIEKDYDYLYLTAQSEEGEWVILNPTSCTTENPTGANLGCGYNNKSNGWVAEIVDLSMFVDSEVLLQFEYVTDAAVNGEGFLLDDIRIEAIDYFTDFEQDDGGWKGDGFVRIQNRIPQQVGVTFIEDISELNFEAQTINQTYSREVTLKNKSQQRDAMIVISGLTRYTRQPTEYRIKITPLN